MLILLSYCGSPLKKNVSRDCKKTSPSIYNDAGKVAMNPGEETDSNGGFGEKDDMIRGKTNVSRALDEEESATESQTTETKNISKESTSDCN